MSEEKVNPNGTVRRPRTDHKKKKRRRSSGAKVALAFLYVVLVIGVSAVLATVAWSWANDLLALNKEQKTTIVTLSEDLFTYTTGIDENGNSYTESHADMDYVTDLLEESGLIEYKFLFHIFSRFSNAEYKLVPGTYELDTDMDYRALVANMSSSSSTRQTVDVTIPEGYNIDQIFELLEKNEVSTVEKLQDTAANYPYKWSFLQDIPLGDYHRLEGYLFPDTYTFYLGEDPIYVLNKLLNGFHSKMKSYYDLFEETVDEEGETVEPAYSLHDIVIIASLIEKETDGSDYRDISSVIFNRLENPDAETAGYLQIDATLVYINGGNVPTEKDKTINSKYNTYLYQGLPEGPICNPGMSSLYAAMNPNSTDYYYYVLNPSTGSHEFTAAYSEHQILVDEYSSSDYE